MEPKNLITGKPYSGRNAAALEAASAARSWSGWWITWKQGKAIGLTPRLRAGERPAVKLCYGQGLWVDMWNLDQCDYDAAGLSDEIVDRLSGGQLGIVPDLPPEMVVVGYRPAMSRVKVGQVDVKVKGRWVKKDCYRMVPKLDGSGRPVMVPNRQDERKVRFLEMLEHNGPDRGIGVFCYRVGVGYHTGLAWAREAFRADPRGTYDQIRNRCGVSREEEEYDATGAGKNIYGDDMMEVA